MRALARIGVVCALPLALLSPHDASAASPGSAIVAGQVVVELDQREVAAGPGEKVTFESTIRNTGDRPLADYVAHLNILSTDKSVYVDPEDWSPKRTQFLDDVPPSGSTTLDWDVRAVTSGPILLFVSVTSPTADTVSSSGPLQMTVGGQRVVNAGGVLPLVLWMPAGVLALLGATSVRRRRHR
jgi:uncharacterized membrane protein